MTKTPQEIEKARDRQRAGTAIGIAIVAVILFFTMCRGESSTTGQQGSSPESANVPTNTAPGTQPAPVAPTVAVAPAPAVGVEPTAAAAVAAAPAPEAPAPARRPENAEPDPIVVAIPALAPERVRTHVAAPRKSGGGRMVLLQTSEIRGLYDITAISYTVDDTATYGKEDETGALNGKEPFVVLDTVIVPGPHRIVARLKIRGATNAAVPYLKTMELELEHAFHFTAEVGTDYQLVSILMMNKGTTVKYEDKPDVVFSKVALDLGPAADTSAVTAQAEDPKATRLVILQHNEVRTKYRVIGISYTLDGHTAVNMQDESVNLDDQTPLVLFDGRTTPGRHHIEVKYRLRGATDRAMAEVKTAGEMLEKQYDFDVKAGTEAEIVGTISAKAGATVTDANRPEINFTQGRVSASGRLPPPAVAAAGPSGG